MNTIKEIMHTTPLSCRKDESIVAVVNRLFLSEVNFLPVLNETKEVVGIVTYQDICLGLGKALNSKAELKISEVMNPNIATVSAFDDEAFALNVMRTKRLRSLAVVGQNNKLCGTINFITLARRILSLKRELEVISLNRNLPQFEATHFLQPLG